MSNYNEGGFTAPTEQIYGNLSYEQLLGRAVDRCLHYRVVSKEIFYIDAVQALHLSLVDIGGKPLRSKANESWERISLLDCNLVKKYDMLFSEITAILAQYKMLFRSVMVETGREQVFR